MTQVPPPRWDDARLTADSEAAKSVFRQERFQEPLELYLGYFETYREAVEELIEGTVDLSLLAEQAVDLLVQPDMLVTIRYLASPRISEDDLKVIADAVLTPTRIKSDGEMAKRIIATVLLALDRNRFPWVAEEREPTPEERSAAVISTAALIAMQKTETARRNQSKNSQEQLAAEYLVSLGFTQVATRTIRNTNDMPAPGEFCAESMFGSRKADLVVRLWDGRSMPIECKVSNSSTNSVKRLNNDAAVKAGVWLAEFGKLNVIPTAVISGVFKVHHLDAAQDNGLTIFWANNLGPLGEFINKTKPATG